MSRARTAAACDASVAQDMIQSAFGGEPIAPEDCYTRIRTSTRTKVEAARQWADIPDDPAAIAIWMRGEPINAVKVAG